MKERIEEKLESNIERILGKEELSASDVAILKETLEELKREENKEKEDKRMKEMMNMLAEGVFIIINFRKQQSHMIPIVRCTNSHIIAYPGSCFTFIERH